MLRNDFELEFRDKILIIDGSLSSEIQRRSKGNVPASVPRYLMEDAQLVGEIHKAYSSNGAKILVAGTAEANRLTLNSLGLGEMLASINRKAVAICRENATKGNWVFGGLGTTRALLKPYGHLEEQDYRDVYREQVGLLIEANVDGFILEGFSSLIEAEQCILAIRDCCAMPIIATMTLLEDGRTKFGDTAEDCFQALLKCGADSVGVHGTLGPLEIDEFIARLKRSFPLCVRPNAGYPVRLGNTMTYLSSPEYVAECAEQFVAHGAVIIGGAAGFTPDHIGAIASRLHGRRPVTFPKVVEGGEDEHSRARATAEEEMAAPASLARKLGHEPIVTVELEPPQGLEIDSIIELLKKLKPYGVDAVNIPENPLARARISSIALAKVIHERTGLESIAHLTCRDRNLISLQAELLGAHVLGVNTILALTGDPARIGDFPTATSIFDVNSLGLVEILARMNLGKDFGMNDLGTSTQFNIGVAANPFAQNLDEEMSRIEAKLERGANFIQTQPIFDPKSVGPFLKLLEPFKVPVIFGVMLIRDYRHAKFLVNEYPGIHIHDSDLDRFRTGGEKEQDRLSVDFACHLIRELKGLSGGIYLMPSFGDAEKLVDVMAQFSGR